MIPIEKIIQAAKKTVYAIRKRPTKKVKVEMLKEHYSFFQKAADNLDMTLDDYFVFFMYNKAEEAGAKIELEKIRDWERRQAEDN